MENFKHYLCQNIIQNCPVTNDDINREQRIFQHEIGHLKGSTTRKTPKAICEERIEIPCELIHQQDNFCLYIDMFSINGMSMLTSIDLSIQDRALVCLDNREADSLYNGIDIVLCSYNRAGYFIKKIYCDREFKPLMNDIEDDIDIEINYPPQGDHVPEAERNNRTIGEHVCAGYHRLPYNCLLYTSPSPRD